MAAALFRSPDGDGDTPSPRVTAWGPPLGGMMVAVPVPPEAYGTDSLAGIGPDGFADGGPLDVMPPGPLLEMLTEQVVTGATPFNWVPGTSRDRDEAGAEAASRAAGDAPLAGIPGVPGAAGVRDLTADELLGTISAVRRIADRAEWMVLALASELIRRRLAEGEAAADRARWPDSPPPGQPAPAEQPDQPRPAQQRDDQAPDEHEPVRQLPGSRRRSAPGLLDAYATATEELRFQLMLGPREAEELSGLAMAAPGRLPAMMAQMAQGMANWPRTLAVHRATADLSDVDAQLVDAALAPQARQLTVGQLGTRARYLAMKLDPESADRRQKRGMKDTRVETWPEGSGNAALAGRELDPQVVLAANAYYDSIAKLLRRAGLPGTLRELRVLAFTDRNTGKDPLDRIPGYPLAGQASADAANDADAGDPNAGNLSAGNPRPGNPSPGNLSEGSLSAARPSTASPCAGSHDSDGFAAGSSSAEGLRDDGWRDDEQWSSWDEEDHGDTSGGAGDAAAAPVDAGHGDLRAGNAGDGDPGANTARGGGRRQSGPDGRGRHESGGTSAFPANIHLLIPVGTMLGWSGAPGQASRLGFLGPQATRDLVQAASRHPRTRWQVTLVGPDGIAIAHGRARGQHPWPPASATGPPGPPGRPGRPAAGTTFAERAAQVGDLLARLGVTLTPVARGGCDHSGHEDRYVPSDRLKDLVRARNATCPAPGCGAQSVYSDLDHTTPWPSGPTDQCNLGPPCRRHHKLKQTPGWRLEQPEPGVFRWTAPSGRTYMTAPTVYDP